jgi:cell division FtsZ-interacting protein ZapD
VPPGSGAMLVLMLVLVLVLMLVLMLVRITTQSRTLLCANSLYQDACHR